MSLPERFNLLVYLWLWRLSTCLMLASLRLAHVGNRWGETRVSSSGSFITYAVTRVRFWPADGESPF